MKILISSTVLTIILCFSTNLQASERSHHAAALKLIDSSDAKKKLKEMQQNSYQTMIDADPNLAMFEDIIRPDLKKMFNYKKFRQEYAKIYKKHFTESELKEIFRFNNSTVGKKIKSALPLITNAGAKMATNAANLGMPKLMEKVRKRAKEIIAKSEAQKAKSNK